MTDILSNEGITIESAPMASSHPALPNTQAVPGRQLAPSNTAADTAEQNSAPLAPSTGPINKDQAVTSLFGSDVPQNGFRQTLLAQNGATPPAGAAAPGNKGPVDIFAAEGIESAPSITEQNTNAFDSGAKLPPQPGAAPDSSPQGAVLSGGAPISRSAMNMPPGSAPLGAEQPHAYIDQNRQSWIALAQQRYPAAQIEDWKNNPISLSTFAGQLSNNQIRPFGGVTEGINDVALAHIAGKVKNGEELNPGETKLLNNYIDTNAEQAVRGFTWGGKVAFVGAQIPAWAMEWALTGGAASEIKATVGSAVMGAVDNAVASKVLATGAEVATRTALMPGQYTAKYGERQLNSAMAVTDKGQMVYQQAQESPAVSALLAFGHTAADVAGQMAAGPIESKVVAPAGRLLSTPIQAAAKALPMPVKSALYDAWQKVNPNATWSDMLSTTGWHGMIAQLGANRVTDALNASLNLGTEKNYTMDDYLQALTPSKDQLQVEGGLIAIGGGIHTAGSMAFNILRSKGMPADKASETVDNMSATEKEGFVNDQQPKPQSAYPMPDEKTAPDLDKQNAVQGYQERLNSLNIDTNDVGQKKPLIAWLREQGGVGLDTELAGELKNAGIDNKTAPGLFRKGNGAGELDNIPAGEFAARFNVNPERDGTYGDYVSRDWLIEALRDETFGKRIGQQTPEQDAGFQQLLDEHGLDHRTTSAEQLYKMFGSDPEIYKEANAQGETITDADTRAIRQIMTDNPEYTVEDAVSSWAEQTSIREFGLASGTPINGTNDTPEADIIKGQIISKQNKAMPPINDQESTFNQLYRGMVNDREPIDALEKMALQRGHKFADGNVDNPKMRAALYTQNIGVAQENLQVATSTWDEHGNKKVTGKALKPILDDLDNLLLPIEPNRKQREKDINDFLIAERFLEVASNDRAAGRREHVRELDAAGVDKTSSFDKETIRVSPEQEAKSISDMVRLADKYGENFHLIGKLAEEVYSFQGRILDMLVDSGVMSKELRATLAESKKYVPLNRMLDDAEKASSGDVLSTNRGLGDTNVNKVVKRLRGSNKDVENPIYSIIRSTARSVDLAERNHVKGTIVKLADVLPEYIQKTEAPIVPKGTATLRVVYDHKLREKLEKAVDFFKHDLERTESVKLKGFRNVLGKYSPMEKLIQLKIGSNEHVLTHEVGHMLDYRLGLKERMLKDKTVKDELRTLAEDRLNSEHDLIPGDEGVRFREKKEKASGKYERYIKNDREILANFFDAYVNAPQQVEKTAPTAKAAFEKIIDADPQLAFIRDIYPSTNARSESIEKTVYGKAEYAPANSMTYYRDGQKEYYRLAKPLLKAVEGMTPGKLELTSRILLAPFRITAGILRTGATLTPEFATRNVLRDQHDGLMQTGGKYSALWFPKSLFAAIGKTEDYHAWVRSGGMFGSFMNIDDKSIEHAYRDLFNPHGFLEQAMKHPFESFMQGLEYLPKKGEQATRIGVFRQQKATGASDVEAAYQSLEATLNFARAGSVGRIANRYIPFLNAGIQGSDKLIRTFKDNPKMATFLGVSTITIPSLMLSGWYLYQADDDRRQAYLEIPQWRKDAFWVVPSGSGPNDFAYYPKPFTYGYIFGSIPERLMLYMYGGNKPEGKSAYLEILEGLAGSVSPINDWSAVIPPLLKTYIEDITDYNFFMDKPIYPKWMGDLVPEKRAQSFTSDTSKLLGHYLNISPAEIDNTVNGLGGGTGKYGLQAGDMILRGVKELNGQDVPAKPVGPEDLPLLRGFISRAPIGYNSNSVKNFFSTYDDLREISKTASSLKGEDKGQYNEENAQKIEQFKMMDGFFKNIKGVQKQIDVIYQDTQMSGKEKTEALIPLQQQITDIAREANSTYKETIKNGGQ